MVVGRLGRIGCMASLLGACSVPNPAFDPPRKTDTDPLPPPDDDGGAETTGVMPAGTADTTPLDDTGSTPLCNGMPEDEVGFRIFRDGNPVQRCGTVTERHCTLIRNESQSRWELTGPECCLDGDLCASEARYVLEFAPAGPDVNLGSLEVGIRFQFSPADMGCDLEWLQIDEPAAPVGTPELVYMAAGNLEANAFVSVPAEPGEALPGEICECAEPDASCCPDGLGGHWLHLAHDSGTVDLAPDDPTRTFPVGGTDFGIELNLVRAWQPPVCDATAQYQWMVRRKWPLG